jgi:hypothetical protein
MLATLGRDICSTMRPTRRVRLVSSGGRLVRKKVVTTTYTYDNNGNVAQKKTDCVTTTFMWDYANRLTDLGVSGATTTYGYDVPRGRRVWSKN